MDISTRTLGKPDDLPPARRKNSAVFAPSQAGQRKTLSRLLRYELRRFTSPANPAAFPSRDRGPRATHTLRGEADSQHQAESANSSEDVFSSLPHPLADARGGQRFHVERLLTDRAVKGRQTSYLVRWRGYPPSADSREPRSKLMLDVLGLVEKYEKAH